MLFVSLNVGILAIFYTILGGVLSYVMHYLFDEFDKDWKERSLVYQYFDVSVEVVLIGLVAFWTIFYIKDAPPIFRVGKSIDGFVDSYISGIFFSFSLFLFSDDLQSKIKYLNQKAIGPILKHLPTKGSILDASLTYE